MKKSLVLTLAMTMLGASVVTPTPSQAALGLLTGNLPLFVTGAVFASVGTPVFVTCVGTPWGRRCHVGWYTGFLGAFGFLLLDGQQSQTVGFGELTPAQASQLGINSTQLDAYNHELSEINAVRESIEGDALARVNQGEKVLESDLHAQWASYQSLFSADAFAALEKVSAQAAPVIQSAAQ